MELRQLDLQRQVRGGQLPKLLEELTELGIREPSKLPCGLPRGVGEEGAGEALLRGPALHATAALCLATGAAGAGLVAPDLRHRLDRGAAVGRKPAAPLHAKLTDGSTGRLPVIDAGGSSEPTTDQLGALRPQAPLYDIGSFELQR